MKLLPAHILRRLNADDRKSLGKAGMLPEESKAIGETRNEKELQRLCYLELLRRGLFFHYSRMDKKSRSRLGTPDFALPLNGEYVAIECKTSTSRTSLDQNKVAKQIDDQGGYYYVVRTFDQFLAILKGDI